MIEELLTVGIATKNRHEELQITLSQLKEGPLQKCRIVVVDDGSTPVIEIPESCENVTLIRHDESKDVAYSRNEIAESIRTPFWLTLDDDSYPVVVDVDELIVLLQQSANVIAISCPFKEKYHNEWRWLNPSIHSHCYTVRTFVACSAIINVSRFLEIGGYSDWVYQFGEESDLSLRALKKGYSTIHSDVMKVQHNKVNGARSMDRIDYYGARNQILMAIYYLPVRYIPLRFVKLFMHHFQCLVRHGRYKGVLGIFSGLIQGCCNLSLRKQNALSCEEYQRFRALSAS
jgi:GT2 family glycosyltransferase